MRKVLYILGQLTDQDAEWLARNGRRREVPAGETLIRQGQPVSAMFILLDGHLEVQVNGIGRVARLGSGEIVGEMSFVDKAPPAASVLSLENCVVLELDKTAIERRIAEDMGFGMRFYRAIACFLSDRLRATVTRLGYGTAQEEDADQGLAADELDESVLDTVSLAGDRFNRMLKMLGVGS